jgi:uncharacterized membrane protein
MKKFKDTDMQVLLGKVLRTGTFLSIGIVLFGGIIFLYRHGNTIVNYKKFIGIPDFVHYTNQLIPAAFNLKGQAIIQIGIILLIGTPIMRVLFSTVGFLLEKDYLYVFVSLLVFSIIIASMLSGHGG